MRVVLDNITHNYQRPPSVGMPRHALRRRMPNSATGRPDLLGGRVFFFTRRWRLRGFGEGPVPSLYRNLPHTRSVRFNRDLKN